MLDMLNMKTDSSQDDTSIYYLQALKATRPVSWWKWKWSRCWWCFVFRRRRSISWARLVTCKVSVSWIRVNIAQLCDHQPLFLPPTHQIIDSNIWPWYRGFLLNYFSNWPTKPLVSLVFSSAFTSCTQSQRLSEGTCLYLRLVWTDHESWQSQHHQQRSSNMRNGRFVFCWFTHNQMEFWFLIGKAFRHDLILVGAFNVFCLWKAYTCKFWFKTALGVLLVSLIGATLCRMNY